MNMMLFGPELYYLGMALVFVSLTLKRQVQVRRDYQVALALSAIGVLVTGYCLFQQGDLFFKAYRVDLFSQIFKFALALGLFLVLMSPTTWPRLRNATRRNSISSSPPPPSA